MVGVIETLEQKKTDRVAKVREFLEKVLHTTGDSVTNQDRMAYLSSVSNYASKLAMTRGQNPEIAAIAALMHNYYWIKTGMTSFPGPNSADAARPVLRQTQLFSNEELSVILRAIFYQDDRHLVHGPYEEIIKDAIVLQRHSQKPGNAETESCIVHKGTEHQNDEDRRLKLADYAEKLAGQHIVGVPEDERYRAICKYWPDSDDIHKVLEGKWCAAFVYYCCMQVGIELPIRYPNREYRLAGVGAWLDWARLPETGFFYLDGQAGFTPERGDLVIYDKLLSDDSHDHIGVVLACVDDKLLVAEGNKDNFNYSSLLYRDRAHCILGYIRIADSYRYQFSGEYQPIPGIVV
ncbi:CHAP domain-containing protein [Paenibacillus sp. PR3]|uniref:CHAP domain-containing protein n=2 Tax=Paenibacillus terricola TaxID=2763503 RepID=A0ABR8N0K6_9BACL|nr:CHAP domain-containing protein [Paenibacillus terricola]